MTSDKADNVPGLVYPDGESTVEINEQHDRCMSGFQGEHLIQASCVGGHVLAAVSMVLGLVLKIG